MKQIVALTVAVPIDVCFRAAQACYEDSRFSDAYSALRPGHQYSGRVTVTEPGRSFEVSLAAVDPLTGARIRSLGYRVTYAFTAVGAARTKVEIGVRYSLLAAVAGVGMLRHQAQNEILHRLAGILALEIGSRNGAAV